MKVGDVDISMMSVNEAIRYFTGDYHSQVKAILHTIKMQLALALETQEIKNKIKPIAEHYFKIEKEVLEHIRQEDEILKAYLNDKNLSFEFAGVSMYAIVKEHDAVLKMLEKLARLCNNYFCEEKEHVMLKLCFAKLNNFEQDLRRNIYFENNIFFPKILRTNLAVFK